MIPIALLGLSADPAHLGHLDLSRTVHSLGYQRVWWSITPASPNKRGQGRIPYPHRFALADILLEEHGGPWLQLHDFEAGIHVFTEELRTSIVLGHLNKIYGGVFHFTFVIGSDNWKHFHEWGHPELVLKNNAILIANRGDPTEALMETEAAKRFEAEQDKATSGPVTPGCWRIMDDFGHNASSTEIANQLRQGLTPSDLTSRQIDYIKANNLL